jgi:tryptophan-rich sensory protein
MIEEGRPAKSVAKVAAITVPLILGVGFLMGQLSNSGYGNDWFDALVKPAAMPPGWAFGAAWTILYVLLGVSLAIVWSAPPSSARSTSLLIFFIQLLLNFSWSPLFFGAHQIDVALAVIVTILALSIAATQTFTRVRKIAAVLMLPYLAWLAFATYLNFEILTLNRGV